MPSEASKSKEQKAAESDVEGFRKNLGPFVVAAETTRMAMVFADPRKPNHPVIFANDSLLSLAGALPTLSGVAGSRFTRGNWAMPLRNC